MPVGTRARHSLHVGQRVDTRHRPAITGEKQSDGAGAQIESATHLVNAAARGTSVAKRNAPVHTAHSPLTRQLNMESHNGRR